jgi:hypothetical protein
LAHYPNALNAAKVRQKNEILTLYPEYNGMVKKTISRYCPFKDFQATGEAFSPQKRTSSTSTDEIYLPFSE